MKEGLTRRAFLRAGGGTLVGAYVLGLAGCGQTGGGGGGGAWEPIQDVVMIVPFEAGGGSDILGRAMASGMEQVREGVNITVENRPSTTGAVGYSYLLEQQGDPHFMLASETTGVALPIIAETPWTWEDFTPIGQIAEDATLMIVPQDSEFGSLQDVVDAAKQRRLTAGVVGTTGLDTIVFGLLQERVGIELEYVVFESGGELVTALLGGDILLASLNPSEVIGQLEPATSRRSWPLPRSPTRAENWPTYRSPRMKATTSRSPSTGGSSAPVASSRRGGSTGQMPSWPGRRRTTTTSTYRTTTLSP